MSTSFSNQSKELFKFAGMRNEALSYNPASFISGHITVHLHTLARVSVYVNGVDATQQLSIQQVLGTILRRCKQTTPWREEKQKNVGNQSGCAVIYPECRSKAGIKGSVIEK